ncbi:sensor histidine kinase [Corynebacterium caspium]|uniref:sensor histidine kinase n=1 Tax=Corynebacterium caspium TaxID=234828 RepID=UPI0003728484|nr:HAMP domain-containing sensor histidine kinase [Corynebacterium caspium]WKD58727.1 putative sensor histidine kinase TcrY [Corynebacterium caspium DSM 44850]
MTSYHQSADAVGEPAKKRSRYRVPRNGAVPLRLWLVVVLVTISSFGLLASSIAVSSIMREVVYSRVDGELASAIDGWAANAEIFRNNSLGASPPTDYCVIKLFSDGSAVTFNASAGMPDVDNLVADGRIHTIASDPKSASLSRWRVLAVQQDGMITIVGKSLRFEDNILRQLTMMQFTISLMVIILLGVAGYYLIYRSLRPLREVEETAGEIAQGDLDLRVPQWPINTEVGRLAYALNSMLGQLQASIEQSRKKEDQMRRFVGDASHELRTPLTSVRGYTELYRSGATTDVNMVLSKVEEESKRMSVLVEDLLALTRAEGQKLEHERVDILELAISVASSTQAAFPNRHIEVRNEAADIPMVMGDAMRLHQVLSNLVTNAIRHAGDDARITIRLRLDQPAINLNNDDPDKVVIEVIDDGIGMPPEVASHIFERFYRADSSRSRSSGGSGLGLAIAKSLVEQHGGMIEVASLVGEGSTFRIILPSADTQA